MATKFKSFKEFKKELETNEQLQAQFKENPLAAIEQFQSSGVPPDVWTYRIVVLALGFTILATVIGVLWLLGSGSIEDGNNIPQMLTAACSAALGALGGILVPSPAER